MVAGFTTTYAISAYHHWCCEFDTTSCDKVCQWLATGQWFSPGPPISSTNKTDCHDITEILSKVALNTIKQTNIFSHFVVEWLSEDFKTFAKTENSYIQTMTINDGSHLEF